MNEFKVKTSFVADSVFHLLTHMNLQGNPSNLFCPAYLGQMTEMRSVETAGLKKLMKSLKSYYEHNFSRLAVINFLPFYSTNIAELVTMLENYQAFTAEDQEQFVFPFVQLLLEEVDRFYEQFWGEIMKANETNLMTFTTYLAQVLAPLACIFQNTNTNPNVYACASLRKQGRGFPVDSFLSAAVPLVYSFTEYEKIFFQVLHEFTHQLTDGLLKQEIKTEDDSHFLSESIVIIADYYIFEQLNPDRTSAYLKWVGNLCKADIPTIVKLKELFPLPTTMDLSLRELLTELLG